MGVLAYEVLAGERPFVGESYDQLMLQHLTSLPRNLRLVRKDIPPGLNTVVLQAMSRDAAKRYGNVGEFIAAFAEASGVKPGDARGPSPSETGRGSRNPTQDRSLTTTPGKRQPEKPKRGLFGWLRGKKK